MSSFESPSLPTLILSFLTYFLTHRILAHLLTIQFPTLSPRNLLTPFTSHVLGALISLLFSPFCLYAALPSATSTCTSLCLLPRMVLFISELWTICNIPIYLIHHIFSLLALAAIMELGIPVRALAGIYASLVTEVASDISFCLGVLGWGKLCEMGHGEWKAGVVYWVEVLNVVVLLGIRVPGMVFAWSFVNERDIEEGLARGIAGALLGCYASFLGYVLLARLGKLGWVKIRWKKPKGLAIGRNGNVISFYGLCVGMGFLLASAVGMAICLSVVEDRKHEETLKQLVGTVCRTTVMGIAGSRILPIMLEDGILAMWKHPKGTMFKRRFYFHGALIGVSMSLLVEKRDSPVSISTLLAACGIVLPVFESLGRIGCHFAGCCHGGRVPVQLLSASLNGIIFPIVVGALQRGWLDMYSAAVAAVASNAAVRVLMDSLRNDDRVAFVVGDRKVAGTKIIAGVMFLIAVIGLFFRPATGEVHFRGSLELKDVSHILGDRRSLGALYVSWVGVLGVYGYERVLDCKGLK